MVNTNSVLKEALDIVKPSESEINDINTLLKGFIKRIEKNKKNIGTDADVFVGGSFAKKTIIKKDYYDIDIFIRFDKKYPDGRLPELTENILQGMRFERVHGSRDYFKVKASSKLFFEIVPVRRVKSPKESENITDLSYSHVNYIRRKLKGKILDDVLLAKAFCNANGFYGAESYIKGFSGYGLELLIHKYKSFLGFLKAMSKIDLSKKEVIDIEKHHKNKSNVLMDINAAKLTSPIIFVDPTYKHRNVLAALSYETFRSFQKVCKDFLKNPNIKFFKKKDVDVDKLMSHSKKRGYEFVSLVAKTRKQEGDIAGTKLLKFFNFLEREVSILFDVKFSEFEYKKGQVAKLFLAVNKKKCIIIKGPLISHEKHSKRFRSKHKKIHVKNRRLHSKIENKKSIIEFIDSWKEKESNKKIMKDMSIVQLSRD